MHVPEQSLVTGRLLTTICMSQGGSYTLKLIAIVCVFFYAKIMHFPQQGEGEHFFLRGWGGFSCCFSLSR